MFCVSQEAQNSRVSEYFVSLLWSKLDILLNRPIQRNESASFTSIFFQTLSNVLS